LYERFERRVLGASKDAKNCRARTALSLNLPRRAPVARSEDCSEISDGPADLFIEKEEFA